MQHYDGITPTGCNSLNLVNYQINIPIADAFYDPPIPGRTLNNTPYAPLFNRVNFVIDLYELQQEIFEFIDLYELKKNKHDTLPL